MAILARFSFDVPFGKKAGALAAMKEFESVERELGFPKSRRLVGSIGAPESRIVEEYVLDSLAALEEIWANLSDPRMSDFQRKMAPYVVPGSHRWEIFRIQE